MFDIKELEQKIKRLKAGDHLCCIYETDDEHRILITSFMKQGLLSGEKIIYVVDVRTAEDIIEYLRKEGVKVEHYINSGQLNILSVDESYMRGGVFDPDGMIALLKRETQRALDEGYSALRVTGEMSWALRGLPGSYRLIEYESKLNDFFPNSKCLAICQYDKRRFDSGILLDIITTHPIAVIGTQLYDNLYYIAPGDLQGPDPQTARLNNRLQNLRERKLADEAVVKAYDELENKVQERTRELAEANTRIKQDMEQLYFAQTEISERLRFEKLLSDLSTQFINLPLEKIDRTIELSLRQVVTFFGLDRGTLFQISADQKQMILVQTYRIEGIQSVPKVDAAALFPFTWPKLLGGEIISFSSPDNLPKKAAKDRESFRQLNVKSNVTIPLMVGGIPQFVFSIGTNREKRIWDRPVIRRIQLIGELFVNALQRRQKEEELKIKDSAIASSINGIAITDLEGKLLYVNDSFVKMWGYDHAGEILGRFLPEFWEGKHVRQTVRKLHEHESGIGEDIGKRKDGSLFTVQYAANVIKGQTGNPLYMFGSFIDITETKQAEQHLRRSERSLSEAQRIAHLGNWDWSIQTNELVWSDEIFRIFGLNPGEFGATYEAFLASVHPEDRSKVKKAVDRALASPEYQYSIEHRVIRSDGPERIVHEKGEVTFNKKGKAIRMIGTVQDISERKLMEQKLARQLEEINLLKQKLESENIYLRKEIKLQKTHHEIIGKSRCIMQVLNQVEQVAPTDSAVLIQGETGTGKELIAQSIHSLSSRKTEVMVKVNCAAMPAPLIESELFGREKGAYTGALSRQIGRFELAHNSTIFLDEVGELSFELQVKLLRVLQEGAFERLGSPKTIKVDVRIIAASNRNLLAEIAKGHFREDLFYRLNVFPIQVPPLRERTEDIPLLVWNFVNEFAEKMNKEIHHISQKSMDALQAYHWPGNIRELRNVIEHAVIISTNKELQIRLPAYTQSVTSEWQTLEENERCHILRALEKSNWRIKGKSGAAALLGLKPSTLYARMNKLAIPTRREKDNI
jgi:formate hydrogenlyase transcriptional activator